MARLMTRIPKKEGPKSKNCAEMKRDYKEMIAERLINNLAEV
jgi:hypothetical protein